MQVALAVLAGAVLALGLFVASVSAKSAKAGFVIERRFTFRAFVFEALSLDGRRCWICGQQLKATERLGALA